VDADSARRQRTVTNEAESYPTRRLLPLRDAVGLHAGTSRIVAARRQGTAVEAAFELNAFMAAPYAKLTEALLGQNQIAHFRDGDELIIYGSGAERFADMLHADLRRPMAEGLLNPRERRALPVLQALFTSLIPRSKPRGEILAFSVPAAAPGRETALKHHEATLKELFQGMGYGSVAVNEGLAVVLSELEDDNLTGIGISCGAGMCNATLALLSIPVVMVGILGGGDHIDAAVGAVINEHASRVKLMKEEGGVDLTRPPGDTFERALRIYYEELVNTLVDGLRRALAATGTSSRVDRGVPIVLAGGTATARGFRDLFERALEDRPLPLQVSSIRLASEPLTATARGVMAAATYAG